MTGYPFKWVKDKNNFSTRFWEKRRGNYLKNPPFDDWDFE